VNAAEGFAWATAVINTGMLAYAVGSYLRHRDALRGLLVLLYVTGVVIAAVEAYIRFTGRPAWTAVGYAAAVYLFHPVMTLMMASTLHRVSRWVLGGALGLAGVLAVPLVATSRNAIPLIGAVYIVLFISTQTWAACIFAREARQRNGTSAVRLRSASIGAWTLILVPMIATGGGASGLTSSPTNDIVALKPAGVWLVFISHALLALSAVCYLVAFAPPRWPRQVWAARALRTVSRRILDAQPTETPDQVWSRYTRAVREVTGADAVDVLLLDAAGELVLASRDEHDIALPRGLHHGVLDQLMVGGGSVELRQPRWRRRPVQRGPLAEYYAAMWGNVVLTVLPLTAPRVRDGALLVVNRRHSLFAADDLPLLAELAGQAAVLAERGAVVLRKQRLADELAESVAALTEASRAKNDFLAAMSHELRTPLHAIIGFSDLLREDLDGDERQREWVDHIYRSGFHLLALINDLLDLAKIEAGQLDLRRSPLRLDTAVQELLATLRPIINGRQLQVVLQLPEVTASVDAMRFRQIVENLLSNAIKFTEPGGQISVHITTVERDVTVEVADTGVGIPAEEQHLVFEAFQQVRTADKREGTGLGLAVCRRVAQAHGGDLVLHSALGLGTTVTLTLPNAVVEPAAAEARIPAPAEARSPGAAPTA